METGFNRSIDKCIFSGSLVETLAMSPNYVCYKLTLHLIPLLIIVLITIESGSPPNITLLLHKLEISSAFSGRGFLVRGVSNSELSKAHPHVTVWERLGAGKCWWRPRVRERGAQRWPMPSRLMTRPASHNDNSVMGWHY